MAEFDPFSAQSLATKSSAQRQRQQLEDDPFSDNNSNFASSNQNQNQNQNQYQNQNQFQAQDNDDDDDPFGLNNGQSNPFETYNNSNSRPPPPAEDTFWDTPEKPARQQQQQQRQPQQQQQQSQPSSDGFDSFVGGNSNDGWGSSDSPAWGNGRKEQEKEKEEEGSWTNNAPVQASKPPNRRNLLTAVSGHFNSSPSPASSKAVVAKPTVAKVPQENQTGKLLCRCTPKSLLTTTWKGLYYVFEPELGLLSVYRTEKDITLGPTSSKKKMYLNPAYRVTDVKNKVYKGVGHLYYFSIIERVHSENTAGIDETRFKFAGGKVDLPLLNGLRNSVIDFICDEVERREEVTKNFDEVSRQFEEQMNIEAGANGPRFNGDVRARDNEEIRKEREEEANTIRY